MTIAYFGATSNPADGGALDDTGLPTLTPVPSMLAGDLSFMVGLVRSSTEPLTISETGGQTWNSLALHQGASLSVRGFWARFNGTWSANPSIADNQLGICFSIYMAAFRPTAGSNTWAVDVAEVTNNFTAPVAPFDVTATPGSPTVASSTVTIVVFISNDDNTWALQTGGWTNAGTAQYRNTSGSDQSLSVAYQILSSPSALGSVVNRQATLGGDAGRYFAITFKEQSSGVAISSVGDALLHNTETGIVIAGTGFGAAHTGSADVIISPTNNIADGAAVVQTQTAWSNTSVTFTASLGTFGYFTNLYVFVKDSSGSSNSSGYVIQREAWASIAGVLKTLAGATVNSATNIVYHVRAGTANGTQILTGTNGTTDGSGNFVLPTVVLTSGGALAVNDNVWVDAAFDGASLALSPGTIVKVLPTYT